MEKQDLLYKIRPRLVSNQSCFLTKAEFMENPSSRRSQSAMRRSVARSCMGLLVLYMVVILTPLPAPFNPPYAEISRPTNGKESI